MSKETTFSGIRTREDDLLVTAARLLRLWRDLFGQNKKALFAIHRPKR